MTKIRRGNIARRRRTKICLFASSFRGGHSRLTRTITQQKIRALVSSHRDRDKQKRNFCRLWITRINVVIPSWSSTPSVTTNAPDRLPAADQKKECVTLRRDIQTLIRLL